MVEPTRKKRLGRSEVSLIVATPPSKDDALVFTSHHPTRPGRIDLRAFRDGDPRAARTRWWNGPFTGRPQLIQEMLAAIEIRFASAPKKTLTRVLHVLRIYWRLFDRHHALQPVAGVADITDLYGAIQLRENFARSDTSVFLGMVNTARQLQGLPELYWPLNEESSTAVDRPEHRHVATVYHFLKRRVYEILDRNQAVEPEGSAGVGPSQQDIKYLLALFLLRTGWNQQTALDLDIDRCIAPHPMSAAHHVVTAIKNRGNTEQSATGLEKSTLSPGNLLRFLHRSTSGMRNKVEVELTRRQGEKIVSPDSWRVEVAQLRTMLRSPWLFESQTPLGVAAFDGEVGFRHMLREMNGGLPESSQVPETLVLGDLRDAYIGFAYEQSGYSWLVAKIAAGHQSLNALKAYLRQRQWKAHGEKTVRQFSEALWSLIEVRRLVDGAVLRAMVERGEVSDEQVGRWLAHKDRTRLGVGCTSFSRPPIYIAPEHKEGRGCRVQRCTLCEHAVLFDDSMDLVCRRLAELFSLQETIPLTTWVQSSFPEEVRSVEIALERFDAQAAQERLAHWRREIDGGRHLIVEMEGAYE